MPEAESVSWIVDTNVLATANNHHRDAPPDCVAECATKLQAIMEDGHVVLDNDWRILGQYGNNIQGPGPGFEFLQWLYQNRGNTKLCTEVVITPTSHDPEDFLEMPSPLDLPAGEQIDRADRVFLTIAAVHSDHPVIVQATDSKWIGWEAALAAHAISIEWVCREYAELTYAKKMTGSHKKRPSKVQKGAGRKSARRGR